MKPVDALPRDWRLYYEGTWMHHVEKGPRMVHVGENGFNVVTERGSRVRATPGDLVPLWLRPGAYNVSPNKAVYLARRARRSARRSMSTEHYSYKWPVGGRHVSPSTIWKALRQGAYPGIDEVLVRINRDEAESQAVSRDMILAKARGGVAVILRGQVAGYINRGLFVPQAENAPLAKIARGRLMMEGIQC